MSPGNRPSPSLPSHGQRSPAARITSPTAISVRCMAFLVEDARELAAVLRDEGRLARGEPEHREQLLARLAFLPVLRAPHDFEQLVHRLLEAPLACVDAGEREPRVVI